MCLNFDSSGLKSLEILFWPPKHRLFLVYFLTSQLSPLNKRCNYPQLQALSQPNLPLMANIYSPQRQTLNISLLWKQNAAFKYLYSQMFLCRESRGYWSKLVGEMSPVSGLTRSRRDDTRLRWPMSAMHILLNWVQTT